MISTCFGAIVNGDKHEKSWFMVRNSIC